MFCLKGRFWVLKKTMKTLNSLNTTTQVPIHTYTYFLDIFDMWNKPLTRLTWRMTAAKNQCNSFPSSCVTWSFITMLFLPCPKLLNGRRCSVPLEVALMAKVNATAKGPSGVVSLLDWYDLPEELILVLERPVPCLDLIDYLHSCTSSVQEHKAKVGCQWLFLR